MQRKRFYLSMLAAALVVCCGKMDDTYRHFIKDGERHYIGKADSLKVMSGHNRMLLHWLAISDQRITKAKAFWNNRQDSVEVLIHKTAGIDTVAVIVDSLAEGDYSVDVICFDDAGNSSIVVNQVGRVYGEQYIATLLQRPLLNYELTADTLSLFWGSSDSTAIGVALELVDVLDHQHTLTDFSKSDTTKIAIQEMPKYMDYRTLYRPDSLCIDTFYTTVDRLVIDPETYVN